MTGLSYYVRSSTEIKSGALTADGFGRPLILAEHTAWTDRYQLYTDLDGVAEDFTSTSAVYLAAAAMFSQRPRPSSIAVGRRSTAVAQSVKFMIPASPTNTAAYGIRINGVLSTYTTDGSATQAELQSNITTQLNANAHASLFTAATDGSDAVVVTSDQAGIPFTWSIEPGPAAPITAAVQTKLFVIPASPQASTLYQIKIAGVLCGFLTDASPTQAELQAGLITDINLKLGDVLTASASTNDVLVTGDTAGYEFHWEIVSGPSPAITAGAATGLVPNWGVSEDIDAVSAVFTDWYGLVLPDRDAATILTTAAKIETMTKLYLAQSGDANVVDAAYSALAADTPATDVATRLKNRGYTRTAVWYTATSTNQLAASILSRGLAYVPGAITWAIKELVGVNATELSATQRANLVAKSANGYEPIAGRRVTYYGTVAVGEYLDVIHGIDETDSLIQRNCFLVKLNNKKVGMTQGGIMQLNAGVTAALKRKMNDGLFAKSRTLEDGTIQSPAYTTTPPKIEDIALADRATRTLANNPIRWEATLEGAIHFTDVIGEVSA